MTTTKQLSRRTLLQVVASVSGLEGTNLLTDQRLWSASSSRTARFVEPKSPTHTSIKPPEIVSTFTASLKAHYPFRENMYRALQLPDGEIVALSIALQEGQQIMQGHYSMDDGRTWSAARDLFQWPKAEGRFAIFNALVDRDGEIQIFILCDGNSGVLYPKSEEGPATRSGEILDIWHARSRANRRQWHEPKRIWKGHGDDLLSGIQLRDGRLLLPFSSAHDRSWDGNRGGGFLDFTFVGAYNISALYSDDAGASWQQSPDTLSVETGGLSEYGANEPVVLELRDGRVWMLIRTQLGRFYESFSADGGVHWTPPRPTSLISSDSPAGLLRLKDGSILLFSNACLRYPYAQGGRYVLHVAISHDEGRTWHGFREVARDRLRNEPPPPEADYGLSYTFPTLLTDGRVLFSNWVVPNGSVRSFRLLDPAWVLETRQSTDFSHGLDDWSVFGSKGVELQPDPENPGSKVLKVQKADPKWPAGAVWNFPAGSLGQLKAEMLIRRNCDGILLGLTDYFSVPWDLEDRFFNVFNLPIRTNRESLENLKLPEERWFELTLDWSTGDRSCRVSVYGRAAGVIQEHRRANGVNYLRLRSTAMTPDGGVLLRSLDVTVNGVVMTKNAYFGDV